MENPFDPPQGSVIAALLFVIYINDLPKELTNVSKLYADDTKILTQVSSNLCAAKLQADLDNAFKWTQKWLLSFNISKCIVMHYGNNNNKSNKWKKTNDIRYRKRPWSNFQHKSQVEESSHHCNKQSKPNAWSNQEIFCKI